MKNIVYILLGIVALQSCYNPKEIQDHVKSEFPNSQVYKLNMGKDEENSLKNFIVITGDSILHVQVNSISPNIYNVDLITIIK